jgi:hypothetical protein
MLGGDTRLSLTERPFLNTDMVMAVERAMPNLLCHSLAK